jgi:glycosyltransferase involved in cell wall biosynthesis
MVRATLADRGLAPERVRVIRRGLDALPACRALRAERRPLRLLCVARLVPKKGLDRQLEIYAGLAAKGVAFEARVVGDGPLRSRLGARAHELGLDGRVQFLGQRPQSEVQGHLAWADVLLHTGVVAPSGDRDGLPNVIPEAMAAGVIVLTSPAAATTEAVTDQRTGYVLPIERTEEWVARLGRVAESDEGLEEVRLAARAWVEAEFDARRNAGHLLAAMREEMVSGRQP